LLPSLVVAALVSSTSPAIAGRAGIDVEHFQPQIDGRGLFNTDGADTLRQWQFAAVGWLHYMRNPLVISDGTRKRLGLVEDRLTVTAAFSLGLTDWLNVGIAVPLALWNDQNARLQSEGVGVTGFGQMRLQLKLKLTDEQRHGIGIAFIPVVFMPTGNHNAFLGQNFVTFTPRIAIERTFRDTVRLLLNIGYTVREATSFGNLVVDDELYWRVALGIRVRPSVEIGAELVGATAASDLFGGNPRKNPLELLFGARLMLTHFIQVYGGLGPGLSTGYGTPTWRMFAGLTFAPYKRDTDRDGLVDEEDRCPLEPGPRENQGCPWPDTDGDGLTDNVDRCPKIPGPRENRGCPWPDSDGDGVLDKDDKCPLRRGPAENQGCPWPDSDGDGVLDKDDKCPQTRGPHENQGCPWPDSDGDGVLDKDDKCPTVAGPRENEGCPWSDRDGDGVLDKDDKCPDIRGPRENQGCPLPDQDGDGVLDKDDDCPTEAGPRDNKGCPKRDVVVTRSEIRILQQIFFKTGSAKILEKSFPILNQVADALKRHAQIPRIEVQGHTDDVGSKKYNTRLSQKRADAVVEYLIESGVDEKRLAAKGYGPTRPLVTIDKGSMSKAELKAARGKNRRVQFVILERRKR
jgi:outer membrane protein OmpA-like peptidoglycan-associated protein